MLDMANYLGKRIAHHALVHSDSANDGRRQLADAYYYSKRSIRDQDAFKIILSEAIHGIPVGGFLHRPHGPVRRGVADQERLSCVVHVRR